MLFRFICRQSVGEINVSINDWKRGEGTFGLNCLRGWASWWGRFFLFFSGCQPVDSEFGCTEFVVSDHVNGSAALQWSAVFFWLRVSFCELRSEIVESIFFSCRSISRTVSSRARSSFCVKISMKSFMGRRLLVKRQVVDWPVSGRFANLKSVYLQGTGVNTGASDGIGKWPLFFSPDSYG